VVSHRWGTTSHDGRVIIAKNRRWTTFSAISTQQFDAREKPPERVLCVYWLSRPLFTKSKINRLRTNTRGRISKMFTTTATIIIITIFPHLSWSTQKPSRRTPAINVDKVIATHTFPTVVLERNIFVLTRIKCSLFPKHLRVYINIRTRVQTFIYIFIYTSMTRKRYSNCVDRAYKRTSISSNYYWFCKRENLTHVSTSNLRGLKYERKVCYKCDPHVLSAKY